MKGRRVSRPIKIALPVAGSLITVVVAPGIVRWNEINFFGRVTNPLLYASS